MNKMILIGNLGKDPDFTYTPAGVAMARFSLAVNRVSKNNAGEKQTETDWFHIIAWRGLAETCNNYLHKGSKVCIEGRLQIRKYTDRNGVERTAVEVVASEMEMLTPRSGQSPSGGSGEEDDLGDLEELEDERTPF